MFRDEGVKKNISNEFFFHYLIPSHSGGAGGGGSGSFENCKKKTYKKLRKMKSKKLEENIYNFNE